MRRLLFIPMWAAFCFLDSALLTASEWANRGARWADRKARGK